MTDKKRIVEAMGRPFLGFFTDPPRLSEMLDWLAERYGVALESSTLGGPWILHLYRDGFLLYEDNPEEGVSLQEAVARCVLWVLEQEQVLLDAQDGR